MKIKQKKFSIQILLFLTGILLLYFTYNTNEKDDLSKFKSDSADKVQNNKKNAEEKVIEAEKKNKFLDVEYRGIDLSGNRFLIKSGEAEFLVDKPEIIYMKNIKVIFYFKDKTTLFIFADNGVFNNKNNDMKFEKNVKAEYLDNNIFSNKLDYLNSKNLLTIYENVRGNSEKGNIIADKLEFDISKQTLDISMFNKNKINVNVNYK